MSRLASVRTTIRQYTFIQLLIPLALVGLTGSTITFLRTICTGNTRWFVLTFLFLFFIIKRNFLRYFDLPLAFILFAYLIWCFLTSFWSEVPLLSFLKTCLFMVLSLTLIRTSIEWIKVNRWNQALNYLWILAGLSLLAGFFGSSTGYDTIGEAAIQRIGVFKGLTGNANMFGALMAMSLPFFLWMTYINWINIKKRILFLLLTISCIHFLMLSMSRAAMITAVVTLLGFLISLNLNKKLLLLLISINVCVGLLVIYPSAVSNLSETARSYIFKGNSQSLFYSRERNWQTSYDGAQAGGWIGVGYGVSHGESNFNMDYGLKGYLYGREKGNSQLAIIEETGIIGLMLYLLLLCVIFSKLVVMFYRAPDPQHKVLIGILSGIFLGMVAQSGLEAWWDSPGSPESMYFWLLVGIIRGMEILVKNKKRMNYVASGTQA